MEELFNIKTELESQNEKLKQLIAAEEKMITKKKKFTSDEVVNIKIQLQQIFESVKASGEKIKQVIQTLPEEQKVFFKDENEIKLIEIEIEESIKVKNELLNNKRTIAEIDKIAKKSIMQLKKGNKILLAGNGGSAAIASHSVTDFLNVAKISAHTINDAAVLTCMANDYGYEDAFSRVLNTTIKKEDLLIAISSSGNSKNIINSVKTAKKLGAKVVTLSGFSSKNNLRVLGDVNIWSNSKDYGMVEVAHQFILHNLSDRFIDNS